ncbi:UbiD family decarboxylase associated with menaquinone via futalosine [Enhygromyxa salina]|uniref:UbiD family decarboxylase associated with menaquinone via futalosine n=1 Tax=Enhygromyxa salina TaxID=215803 RepID=A0A0C2CYT1_9BACT|nr:UbiD family decarboxylase [Enhygromyxa salina]KIG13017.1 UbiD family decarboxylase associated with menaquinone via futalosine [Enhygromyxa salina]
MGYRSLRECVVDLERHGRLVRVAQPLDPKLVIPEIQRRLYAAGGPAVLFERVEGSPFPAVCNLFGTPERARFLFRDSLALVEAAIAAKADPTAVLRAPWKFWRLPFAGIRSLPRTRWVRAPVLAHRTSLDQLPQIVSWPDDGGAFITLPQVYSEDPDDPRPLRSNLGMYRVQLSGNDYAADEVGLHYQIHRGIGVHHSAAARRGEPLKVSIFVGGPPAHTFAAVMPLPEGLSELVFAGMLGRRRVRLREHEGFRIAADADFCIVGTIDPRATKPEGPFGDHLGYYSLRHDFPVMRVHAVWHREAAIWPFTVVGRPPQEDTSFGKLIHELTGPMVPASIPGLHAMHAVDAAGVHPLLLAVGSERYVPYRPDRPQELLTIANAILGFNQASLAKYLMIVARDDAEPSALDPGDEASFLDHVLRRVDWTRDLHFHTQTTIDTLDYSGSGLNAGSKLVIAARGAPIRELARARPQLSLPPGFGEIELALPGVLAISGPAFVDPATGYASAEQLAAALEPARAQLEGLPLIVLVDDAAFTARTLHNFLWVTFTRSNPSHDVHGVGSSVQHKHWGCSGSLIIDARVKPWHAPPLVEDPMVTAKVDALAAAGGPLHGLL